MNNILITGCTHYGHSNVIKYCERPYKTIEEMNDGLIKNANERADENTIVYHLGDFCFKNSSGGKEGEGTTNRAESYLHQLKGHYIIVAGNHDKNNGVKSKNQRIIMWYAKMYMNLIHDPEDTIISDDKYYYPITLCSHVHKAWKTKEIMNEKGQVALCINCGVDVNNYAPVTMNEILSIFYNWLNKREDKEVIKDCIKKSNEQAIYRKKRYKK